MTYRLWAIDVGGGQACVVENDREWFLISSDSRWRLVKLRDANDALRWSMTVPAELRMHDYASLADLTRDVQREFRATRVASTLPPVVEAARIWPDRLFSAAHTWDSADRQHEVYWAYWLEYASRRLPRWLRHAPPGEQRSGADGTNFDSTRSRPIVEMHVPGADLTERQHAQWLAAVIWKRLWRTERHPASSEISAAVSSPPSAATVTAAPWPAPGYTSVEGWHIVSLLKATAEWAAHGGPQSTTRRLSARWEQLDRAPVGHLLEVTHAEAHARDLQTLSSEETPVHDEALVVATLEQDPRWQNLLIDWYAIAIAHADILGTAVETLLAPTRERGTLVTVLCKLYHELDQSPINERAQILMRLCGRTLDKSDRLFFPMEGVHRGEAETQGGVPSSATSGQILDTGRSAQGAHASVQSAHPAASSPTGRENDRIAYARVRAMRYEVCERLRPAVQAGAAPMRIMARMVAELEATCRRSGVPEDVIARAVVNRTIGDVDLRRVSAEDDGPEFVSLADDTGIALPGEVVGGRVSSGARYRYLRRRMMDFERKLLSRRIDLRMYDLAGVGNPLLREMLAAYTQRHWGFAPPPEQIHLSLGALDGLDKFFRGFAMACRNAGDEQIAVVFPAPSFNVPEWQAKSLGLRLHRLTTRSNNHFKVTPDMLHAVLEEAPDIRAFYLTVSNNPTAFAYTPGELRALFDVLRGRDVLIVADLTYIGTGDPDEDRARMQAFNDPETLAHSVFVSSFSKTHTLTGDRCGWVGFGDAAVAASVIHGWTNSTASLPADWQLRYMALIDLFTAHPELEQRIRALYTHRRARLVEQLRHIDQEHHLFAQVNLDDGGTIYNWSQLRPGADVFSLFSATGIAGVPGSAFGYSDDFIRLSVGCIPVFEYLADVYQLDTSVVAQYPSEARQEEEQGQRQRSRASSGSSMSEDAQRIW